ncbi:MAG: DNA methyltransferase [Clostridia bacterium]|nr:DNA methyltransferase [Clostridia bacterium]
MKDINYAIVETTRPPIYTCMKYWGKKPHNVWYEYIKNYVPNNGVFLDPFCGSGMSAIEAVRAGKKAVCFDLNPLTSFVLDVMCTSFDKKSFSTEAKRIIDIVNSNEIYQSLYGYKKNNILHNAKYKDGFCYECCFINSDTNERVIDTPSNDDLKAINDSKALTFGYSVPVEKFRKSESFNVSLRKKIGSSYKDLYTNRNLFVLGLLFNEIRKIPDCSIQRQLLYAFIQSVHLSTRMCVPRGKKSKRDFSTSWGRSGYFVANTEMEMNPLLLFKNNCFGKQSVSSCLENLSKYVGRIKGKKISDNELINFSDDYDLWYGTIDSKKMSNNIPTNSIDFVLTDPPYGGLVQYLDLSNVWLSWLSLFSSEYSPNYAEEIVINQEKDNNKFCSDITSVIKEIASVSKPEAKMVLTFNNKKIEVWNSLLTSIQVGGYEIEKVIHQQNKRSGESNVCDKYGSSSSDFYIRCKRGNHLNEVLSVSQISSIIVDTAKQIIYARKEPTPYQILLNGLLAIVSEKHYNPDS